MSGAFMTEYEPPVVKKDRVRRAAFVFVLVFVLLETLQIANLFLGLYSAPASVDQAERIVLILQYTGISFIGAVASALGAFAK